MASIDYFSVIPRELTFHILSFLGKKEAAIGSQVSKLFYQAAEDNFSKQLMLCGEARDLKITAKKQLANRCIRCALLFYEIFGLTPLSKENVFEGECQLTPLIKNTAIAMLFEKFKEIYSSLCAEPVETKALHTAISYDQHLQFLLEEGAHLPASMKEKDPFQGEIDVDTLSLVVAYGCTTNTINLIIERKLKVQSFHILNATYNNHPYSTLQLLIDRIEMKITLKVVWLLIEDKYPMDIIINAISKSEGISGDLLHDAIEKMEVNEFILSALIDQFKEYDYPKANYLMTRFFIKVQDKVYSFSVFEKMIDKLPNVWICCLWNSLGRYPSKDILKLMNIEKRPLEEHLERALTHQPDHEIIKRLMGDLRLTDLRLLYFALVGNRGFEGTVNEIFASDITILMVIEAFGPGLSLYDNDYLYRALKYNHSEPILKALINITSHIESSLFEMALNKNCSKEIMDLLRAKCPDAPKESCLVM